MNIKELIKKYKEGESTLEEEKTLFEQSERLDISMAAWARYVKNNKKKSPKGLEQALGDMLQKRRKGIKFAIFAAAASILTLLGFYFGNELQNSSNDEMSFAEKQEKLAEAYAMFDNSETIIYEDDLIILYIE